MVFFQQAVPLPGTTFYQEYRANKMLVTENYDQWLNEQGQLACLVDYPSFSHEEIEKIRDNLMPRYYFSFTYIWKTLVTNLNFEEIKRKFFQESNGFDPDFFAYMEDIDFSWRARLLGYKVYLCGTTYPWHKYDFDRPETRPWKMSALGKNRYLMVLKNYSGKTICLLFTVLLFMDLGVFLFSIYQGWWLGEIKSFFQVLPKIGALHTKKRQV